MPYVRLDAEEMEAVFRCLETVRVGLAGEREGFVLPASVRSRSERLHAVIERLLVRFRPL